MSMQKTITLGLLVLFTVVAGIVAAAQTQKQATGNSRRPASDSAQSVHNTPAQILDWIQTQLAENSAWKYEQTHQSSFKTESESRTELVVGNGCKVTFQAFSSNVSYLFDSQDKLINTYSVKLVDVVDIDFNLLSPSGIEIKSNHVTDCVSGNCTLWDVSLHSTRGAIKCNPSSRSSSVLDPVNGHPTRNDFTGCATIEAGQAVWHSEPVTKNDDVFSVTDEQLAQRMQRALHDLIVACGGTDVKKDLY